MDEYEADVEKRIGTTIAGRWHVESVLGVGGMAAVLLARAPDGSAAALKILHADVNAIPELRKRFLREGPIGHALQEPTPIPGIVRMLEVGEDTDGTAYIAMEAVVGESLFDRLTREGTISIEETLGIAEEVLDVLFVAHGRGVVHRDLKPENLHLGVDGRVRVLDFGIARVLDGLPRNMDGLPEKTPTRTGVIMGTAAYMAPEQAVGLISEIDVRTDLFSLGATMFRMLAGRTVHGPAQRHARADRRSEPSPHRRSRASLPTSRPRCARSWIARARVLETTSLSRRRDDARRRASSSSRRGRSVSGRDLGGSHRCRCASCRRADARRRRPLRDPLKRRSSILGRHLSRPSRILRDQGLRSMNRIDRNFACSRSRSPASPSSPG